eukprot:TRINITY_DN1463_c0_g2_i2.p1 TRINITY_DN1463_c0_g2~~TRINITY_DN1463_c0_g2_i2.p1  ORF type:complete len:217 (+),score=21.88 TRINITY_DN1463_c0_g2_i2:76-651(+)
MAGLLRQATLRPMTSLPLRGAVSTAPIKPIPANFPLKSEKEMGPHGFNRGSYTFWSLKNPIVGPLYRPPWEVGGIHNPTIDPVKHFNMQDRFLTMTWREYARCFFYALLPARSQFVMAFFPICCVLFVTWIEQRREPMEIFMDREEYWKDFDSYCYGVYFDHHHFAHQLCHRRAHKWGYAGQDITLEGDHH